VDGTAHGREVNMKKYAKPKATKINSKVTLTTVA
jgi:hypothetical protein